MRIYRQTQTWSNTDLERIPESKIVQLQLQIEQLQLQFEEFRSKDYEGYIAALENAIMLIFQVLGDHKLGGDKEFPLPGQLERALNGWGPLTEVSGIFTVGRRAPYPGGPKTSVEVIRCSDLTHMAKGRTHVDQGWPKEDCDDCMARVSSAVLF